MTDNGIEKSNALIVILLAAYKPNPDFFQRQLKSIVGQKHTNWICLIGCDSRIDHKYYLQDKRFVWISNTERLGFKRNFENLLALSSNYQPTAIALCDQDDVWYPEKLLKCLSIMTENPSIGMVVHDADVWKEKKLELTYWQIVGKKSEDQEIASLVVRNNLPGFTMVFKAELTDWYTTSPDNIIFHDHLLACLAYLNYRIHCLYECLALYRIHGNNVTGLPRKKSLMAKVSASRKGYSYAKNLYQGIKLMHGGPVEELSNLFESRDLGYHFLIKAFTNKDQLTPRYLAFSVWKFMDCWFQ